MSEINNFDAILTEQRTTFNASFGDFIALYRGVERVWIGDGTDGTDGVLYAEMVDGVVENLGPVTGYYYARQAGFQGTFLEWAQLILDATVSAANAAQSASEALTSENNAEKWATGSTGGTYSLGNSAKEQADIAKDQADRAAVWASGSSSGSGSSTNNAKYWSNLAADSQIAAQNSESNAEAWAVGQRNGTDVPSTDPTYDNNAKFYAEVSVAGRRFIAPDWYENQTRSFEVGEFVQKDANIYMFIVPHEADTPWSSSQVEITNLGALLKDLQDNVVRVQQEQPISENNRIWIKPSQNNILVPTVEEFNELSDLTNSKVPKPVLEGAPGQILQTNGDGTTKWVNNQLATDAKVEEFVDDWLDANMSNPDSPPLDRSLSFHSAAAPADIVGKMPNTWDSVSTGIDFDICDTNGNVILRIENGYIKTKNFNSLELSSLFSDKVDKQQSVSDVGKVMTVNSEGLLKPEIINSPKMYESTTNNIDIDLCDQAGNVILRIQNGYIKTKNFDSINLLETSYTSASNVDFDVCDSYGNVIFRIKDGNIQTKNFASDDVGRASNLTTENKNTLVEAINEINANVDKKPNILTVKSSGGNYTTIRGAIEAAELAGASKSNPYIIQIDPGTYNILGEFTTEEIEENGFVGLMLTDGITLEGMGFSRDDTVLYAEMDDETYDAQKRNDISTLNFRGNVGIKNLTVKGSKIRYAIHDDYSFVSDLPKVRTVDNCKIVAYLTTSWNTGQVSYGAGCDGNKVFIFNDTDFGDTLFIHTYTGPLPNMAIMHNCRAFCFLCKDYPTTGINHFYMYGCSFRWVREEKTSENWVSQHLFLHGDVKGSLVEGWSGMNYELGDTARYELSPVTVYPRAVTNVTSGRYHINTTWYANNTVGVLYYYNSEEQYALVQHGGWICAEILGFESPTIGQYLVVGNAGALSLSDNDTNSIGKVVFETEMGKHFIKLTI